MNALISSGLLAATMVLGQSGEPGNKVVIVSDSAILQAQGQPAQPMAPFIQQPAQQPSSRPILGWFSREDRPIMSKISSWWKREPEPSKNGPPPMSDKGVVIRETPATPTSKSSNPPAPLPNDFPRKLPNPQSKTTPPAPAANIQQANVQPTTQPRAAKTPIAPQFANKIGRDEKFEWMTGQYEIENGNHVLYYATPETIDKYNGRIVLMPQQVEMNQFKKGDLVSVRGQLAQRQTSQGTVPIYRITSAALIERPKS